MSKRRSQPTTSNASAMSPDNVTDEEVAALAVKLLEWARRRWRVEGWREANLALARGCGVEDVVQSAIESLFAPVGGRQWDPTRYPNPWPYLVGVVMSYVNGLRKSVDGRLLRPDGATDVEAEWTATTGEFETSWDPPNLPRPDELLESAEDALWVERAEELLLARIADDEDLIRLYDAINETGSDKPRMLAETLGVSASDINNMKKRLNRHFDAVVAEVKAELAGRREA